MGGSITSTLATRGLFLLLLLAVPGAPLVADALAAKGKPKTTLVSRQSKGAGGAGGDQDSSDPSISADGRYVAFSTRAHNLGGPRDGESWNVYVYDRLKKRVRLVSRRSGKNGAGAHGDSLNPEISANGRYVAFETFADNLGGPVEAGVVVNVYVYDLVKKRVRLVSRRSGKSGAGADGNSFSPELSASGRYIAFTTGANNLGGPLDTSVDNVYVYDLKKKRVQLVSRRSGRNGVGGDGHSFTPTLSADGRFVGFTSEADNLGGPLDTSVDNIYLYDRSKKRVRLVSRRSGRSGAGGNDDSNDAFISGNGRFVGFESNATNLGGPIQTDPLDFDANIYVYDLERKRVELVSRQSKRAGGKGANDDSDDPVLSHSGRYVAFETNATNLGGPLNPANTSDNAYLYDRKLKRVELVGRASGRKGAACDDDCEDPYVSANGRYVAFEGEAQNFGGPIVPGRDNVWVRDRGR